ncbi:MAG: PIN domain-containing protein [Halobacteriales archaeon]|nr:PIN domain-containing protein [Halobacteriales archaeon]
MSARTPLFIDTGAFFARFNESDEHHAVASAVFEDIRSGDGGYSPLYTSRFVLYELVDLLLYKVGYDTALGALDAILASESFNVLPVTEKTVRKARDEFERYDDQRISFVDHTSAVLCEEREIDRVFGFDSDFRTLGFELVPSK